VKPESVHGHRAFSLDGPVNGLAGYLLECSRLPCVSPETLEFDKKKAGEIDEEYKRNYEGRR
jgi:hypothetical protein